MEEGVPLSVTFCEDKTNAPPAFIAQSLFSLWLPDRPVSSSAAALSGLSYMGRRSVPRKQGTRLDCPAPSSTTMTENSPRQTKWHDRMAPTHSLRLLNRRNNRKFSVRRLWYESCSKQKPNLIRRELTMPAETENTKGPADDQDCEAESLPRFISSLALCLFTTGDAP